MGLAAGAVVGRHGAAAVGAAEAASVHSGVRCAVVDIGPSPNIDAMATNGGVAIQCRPQLTGGNPPAILSYAAQLASRAATLLTLVAELERTRDVLRQSWPTGQGSTAAASKVTSTLTELGKLIQAILAFVRELEGAAGKLTTAYTGANAAVRATDPTVGALRSNPYTQAAASALATGSTSIIAAFLRAVSSVLSAIGQKNMAQILQAVASIASAVGQLQPGTGSTAIPALTSTATTGATPATTVSSPTLPDLGTLTGTPTTTTGTTTTGTTTTGTTGTTPTLGTLTGSNSTGFIPVTQGTGTAATPPATTTGTVATPVASTTTAPAHHVTVTVNADGSVKVDADTSAQVDVVETAADGTKVDRHITVDADGNTVAVG
jgi:uncharacterized protein YukE